MLFLFDAQSGGNLLKKLEISQTPVNHPYLQYKIGVCHFKDLTEVNQEYLKYLNIAFI